ncbi:hypothetical protein TNCT_221521 [Trichonephila clavata]|uniref:Uncharacterized protein n=1 Tax=Trichonephila clavata TaxID=2740835 RepID=A0A8X6LXR2_TRICU|nr:hypothetical protein TNCT_221521 [Trichonephila clavata]
MYWKMDFSENELIEYDFEISTIDSNAKFHSFLVVKYTFRIRGAPAKNHPRGTVRGGTKRSSASPAGHDSHLPRDSLSLVTRQWSFSGPVSWIQSMRHFSSPASHRVFNFRFRFADRGHRGRSFEGDTRCIFSARSAKRD